MNDIFEMVDELRELQKLYNTGELRNFDFESKIFKYEQQIEKFEQSMEQHFAHEDC